MQAEEEEERRPEHAFHTSQAESKTHFRRLLVLQGYFYYLYYIYFISANAQSNTVEGDVFTYFIISFGALIITPGAFLF